MNFNDILSNWNIIIKKAHPEIEINGSPERSEFRIVIQDEDSKRYILEQINPRDKERRLIIAETLNELKENKLSKGVFYIKNNQGQFITITAEGIFMLQPYIKNIPLNRRQYFFEEWRGSESAKWLLEFKEKSSNLKTKQETFNLQEYVKQIAKDIENHKSEISEIVNKIVKHLEDDFFKKMNNLPITFNHGDLHPVNFLWGDKEILGVIDWEFCGNKIENYDLANYIGCLGFENPNNLTRGMTKELVKTLRKENYMTKESWDTLIDCIIANRFAWISEWIKKDFDDVLVMELDYIHLLIKNKTKIYSAWKKDKELNLV